MSFLYHFLHYKYYPFFSSSAPLELSYMLTLEGSHPSLYIPTAFYLHKSTNPTMPSESPAHHRQTKSLVKCRNKYHMNKNIGILEISVSLIIVTRWDVLTISYSFSKYIQRFFNGKNIPLSNTVWLCVRFTLHCQLSLQNSLQIQMIHRFHLVCPASRLVWRATVLCHLNSTPFLWSCMTSARDEGARSCRPTTVGLLIPCLKSPQLSLIYCFFTSFLFLATHYH